MLATLAAAAGTAVTVPAFGRRIASYPRAERELMAPVPGGRVYVRVNGRLEGPRSPIVAIHGGPGGTHASLLELLALAGERAVILYDQLDSGRSDRPGNPANWRVGRFVDELEAIRRALRISRWHVLGHSWGGTIALEYGARRPAELKALTLASPLISTRSWIEDANALRAELPLAVQRTLRSCDPPAAITRACENATEIFYRSFNRRYDQPDAMRDYALHHEGMGFNRTLYETMWGSSEFVATGTLKTYNGEPLLDRLNGARTLFIDGQYDEARPATLDRFAHRVAGSEFAVIPGAAHGFLNDRPREALGILQPWLERQDGI